MYMVAQNETLNKNVINLGDRTYFNSYFWSAIRAHISAKFHSFIFI